MKHLIKKLDAELNTLGFGLMRLPMSSDNWFDRSVFDLLDRSIAMGINYFDTGYYYQNGRSEELVREALVKRYSRESFYIADKLPVWDCKSKDDMERIFDIQIKRLGVEYIDFYLLHALHRKRWEKIYNAGVLDFIEQKKKEGIIRRIGFSIHDSCEVMKDVLDAYSWDFAQIQLNYYDWFVLHTEDNYRLLEERGMPCITMESVGGGRLSTLPKEAERVFGAVHKEWSPSAWAIRFVSTLPNVAVVLSGMNSEEQLFDNLKNSNCGAALSKEEQIAIKEVVSIIRSKEVIPCTACRYCVSECPRKIDIPQVFKSYNDYKIFENPKYFDIAYNLLAGFPRAGNCIKCGKCKTNCPQNIDIPQMMKKVGAFAAGREIGIEEIRANRIICFGCGDYGRRVLEYLGCFMVKDIVFSDNNSEKWGKMFGGYPVIKPEKIIELIKGDDTKIIISTPKYHSEIVRQLRNMGVPESRIMNL